MTGNYVLIIWKFNETVEAVEILKAGSLWCIESWFTTSNYGK